MGPRYGYQQHDLPGCRSLGSSGLVKISDIVVVGMAKMLSHEIPWSIILENKIWFGSTEC